MIMISAFMEGLLHAREANTCFTWIITFLSHNKPVRHYFYPRFKDINNKETKMINPRIEI